MWQAVVEDFRRLPDVDVYSLRDARLPASTTENLTSVYEHPRESFFNLAVGCDYTLIIAPEFQQHLLRYTAGIEAFGVKLLSPNTNFVQLAGDKTRTSDRLSGFKVPTPHGVKLQPGESVPHDFKFPAVMKTNDGAGSMCEVIDTPPQQTYEDVMRIEQMVNGVACSVSFFCQGAGQPIACPPMRQILSSDGRMTYLGGARMMDQDLAERATALASKAIAAMPATNGYVGVDLVLGDDSAGKDDVVIEINPRLTTSYIGLREIAESNLAEAMLHIAQGNAAAPSFSSRNVHFDADGTIN